MDWILDNYVNVFGVIGAAATLAAVIAKLTPTDADDKLVAKFQKFLDFVSLRILK